MKSICLFVASSLLLCGAGPDVSKPKGPPDAGKIFDRWDANHDNLLDRTEFETGMKQMMEQRRHHDGRGHGRGHGESESGFRGRRGQADGERNGNRGERGGERADRREDRRGNHADRFFERWDADKDGVVTQTEFTGPAERFNFFDRNGDGKIERGELPAPRNDRGPPPDDQPRQPED
jgi:hypothetical protein